MIISKTSETGLSCENLIGLAQRSVRRQDFYQALEYLSCAESKYSDLGLMGYNLLAQVYFEIGQIEKSNEIFHFLNEKFCQGSDRLNIFRSKVLFHLGRYDDTAQILDEKLAASRDAEVLLLNSLISSLKGNFDSSIYYYRELKKQDDVTISFDAFMALTHNMLKFKFATEADRLVNDEVNQYASITNHDPSIRPVLDRWNVLVNSKHEYLGVQKKIASVIEDDASKQSWKFILSLGQLGDAYVMLASLKRFIEDREACLGVKRISLFVAERFIPIARMFETAFDLYSIDQVSTRSLSVVYSGFDSFRPNIPIILHPNYLAWRNNGLRVKNKYIRTNVITSFFTSVNLSPFIRLDKPITHPKDHRSANELFLKLGGINNKSLIIAPHANSIDTKALLQSGFWEKLVEEYKNRGYVVFQNVGLANEIKISGATPVNIPLASVIPFFEMCGKAVMLRSGLSDIVMSAECKNCVLTPSNNKHSQYSLEQFADNSLLHSIVFNASEPNKVLDKVMALLD